MTDRAADTGIDPALLRPVHGWAECHDCGLVQVMPEAPAGMTVRCCRCHFKLRTTRADPVAVALACNLAALCLYVVALAFPLMTLDLKGRTHTVDVLTGPLDLLGSGNVLAIIGAIVLVATVLVPGVVLIGNLMILIGLGRRPIAAIVPHLLRLHQKIRPWSMIEVYMLGIFVAWSKLVALAYVELDPAIFALSAIMILMIATDAAFDAHWAWARIGIPAGRCGPPLDAPPADPRRVVACHGCELVLVCEDVAEPDAAAARPWAAGHATDGRHCPRCATPLARRKPDSLRRTTALLCAAAVLYIPANALPVLTLTRFDRGEPATIIAGVEQLYDDGMLPLALLVFVASITVPCLKVLSLAGMVLMTRLRSDALLHDRTRLFRVVDFIGRWSMIDVFMISILVAIVRFGFLANVRAEPGCVAFAMVVILTIFAANSFDPRLMWDAAAARGGAPAPSRPSPPSSPIAATGHASAEPA